VSEADPPDGQADQPTSESAGREVARPEGDGGSAGPGPARGAPVPRRRVITVGIAALVVVAVTSSLWMGLGDDAPLEYPPLRRNADAYQGLGVWIDVHDDSLLDDPRGTVEAMLQRGVRTIYLETSNYDRSEDIYRPAAQSEFIDAAHEHGIDVVAWYLPGLDDLNRDLRRSLAAIRFESPQGQRFDGFAMDIESTVVDKIGERNRALARLSQRLRETVGDDYTLGGIIPSPVGLATPFTGYWPNFPYETVAAYYDVVLPMAYSSYRAHGLAETHDYIAECFRILREGSGDPSIPVHIIGGLARSYTQKETQGFVDAAREYGALGASIYDLATTNADSWPELEEAPMNPPQWPPLPVALGSRYATRPMGNIGRGEDRTHPKEVYFSLGPVPGTASVSFELFGSPSNKVQLFVNDRDVSDLSSRAVGIDWGPRQDIAVPKRLWNPEGENLIRFEAPGDWPNWSTWGVRAVEVGP